MTGTNVVIEERHLTARLRVQLVLGDLTTETVDAIVNAANAHLYHGGGVAGAISRKGGPTIQAESDRWVQQNGPASHGRPAVTRAGTLPCKYVIHAVGPVWGSGEEDQKLETAVTACLRTAAEMELESVAMPAISTGIFGFPVERAAAVILNAVGAYAAATAETTLRVVRIVLYEPGTPGAFQKAWEMWAR